MKNQFAKIFFAAVISIVTLSSAGASVDRRIQERVNSAAYLAEQPLSEEAAFADSNSAPDREPSSDQRASDDDVVLLD